MTPAEISGFIQTVGVPIALAVGFAYFAYKAVWPFVVSQINDANERAEQQRREFMAALERRDSQFDQVVSALNGLTMRLVALGVLPPEDARK